MATLSLTLRCRSMPLQIQADLEPIQTGGISPHQWGYNPQCKEQIKQASL